MKIPHFLTLSFLCTVICVGGNLRLVQAKTNSPEFVKSYFLTQAMTAKEYRLANGLSVFLIPNEKAPATSIYHWVKAGSLHETKGLTGMAHLFEHMMFRPLSPKAKPFFDQVKELGGNANANTRFQSTVFTTTAPNENLKKLLQIESDRFQKLKVSDELLNVERKAVWSEYSTKFDSSPFVDLWYQIYHMAFPTHPYGWMIIGDREDLDKIRAKDCNEFFTRFYRPNNVGLFIAGDFKSEEVLKWVQQYYGNWKKGENAALPPAYSGQVKYEIGSGKIPSQSRNTLLGIRIPDWNEHTTTQLNLAAYVLIGSRYSLLDRRLRDQTKIASMVQEFNIDYDTGLMKFLFILNQKTTVENLTQEFMKTLDDLKAMKEEEFAAYVKNFQTSLKEGTLRNENVVALSAAAWGKWGSLQFLADDLNKDMKITKKELVQFLEPLMKKDNLVIVTSPEPKK